MASTSSQEASTSNSPSSDQIFLSFRGEDTRKNFVDHLYTALNYAGFHTFRVDDVERGENIESEWQKAIQESRIALVVLSKKYAFSSWCLDELVMILKCKSTISGYVVLPLFYHVDPSDVRNQLGSFKEAFSEHEKKIDAKSGKTRIEWISKVEKWRKALREVADLGGMNLQDLADGHEARFIQKIIEVVGNKLSRTAFHIGPYAIGIHARATKIQFWLADGSADVGLAAICGMDGIGKTTIAKLLYNLNFSRFDGSSFLADVKEVSKQQYGLLGLQRQLIADILKVRNEKISDVDEGIVKIKSALSFKRVLVVIDDVDQPEQLEPVLGMRDWVFPGSKFIITTRHEHLLKRHEGWKVHRIEKLDYYESLELFSLHAFGQRTPDDDFVDASNLAVEYCEGLPLAIEVLGSSLGRSRNLEVWKSQLEKLKAIPNNEILEKLKVSYDSLAKHDQNLFLHLACFFVGCHKDYTITILDGCEFHTLVGIDNLIGRCLVTIDEFNKVVMHRLLQEMGRDIVRQESPENPGKRSRLWNHKDSYKVLTQNKGTSEIQGLVLNMGLLKDDESSNRMLAVNRNHSLDEFLDNSLLSTSGNWLQRCLGSQNSVGIAPADSNQMALEADAFAKMENLKLLQLGDVQIIGRYENFPKEIRWLCWLGFPFQSIPNTFPLETVVALEMPRSNLKILFDRAKFLVLLKILNLSHSHSLASTPDFTALPNLERLLLENCTRLVEIDKSIGQLERLVLLNLRDCSNLRRLPKSIGMLESLRTLDISGCSNLEKWPTETGNMDSLPVVGGDQDSTIQNVKTRRHSFNWSWPLKLRKNPDHTNTLSLHPSDCLSLFSEEEELKEILSEEWVEILSEELEETPSNPRELEDLISVPMEFPPTSSHDDFSIPQVLDLSSTEMKSLPQYIFGLVSLQKLFLRSCAILMMELPPEIGELTSLEVLDLEGTEIVCLPKEIGKLVNLTCLKVSFYGYANQTVIPRRVLSNLSRLNELIIDVTPYGEWWDVEVEAIIDDLRSLKELRTLKIFLPTAELLEELTLIFPGLEKFRFTVGSYGEQFISRLPHDVEEEFNNQEKLEKGLKYVDGDCIPNEITKVIKHADAFFLQRHWSAESLSEFGHENLNEVKFCLVVECNEFRTIIDSEKLYQGKDGSSESEDFPGFDEAMVFRSLEKLIIRYMKNMENIWKGPVGKESLTNLKSLVLHTCPNLTTLFTIDMLSNLFNLEELIVEDCPKINSLVSHKHSGSESVLFLPSLKKISLLWLPGLVSISSGLEIALKLERMVIYDCPMLEKLSTAEVSSTELKVIKGEKEWWNALKWYESDVSTELEDYLARHFIPLTRDGDLIAQLTKD